MRLNWLRDMFGQVGDDSRESDILYATRAYLLYLLGCTLFADKSVVYVSIIYLSLISDLSEVSTYS